MINRQWKLHTVSWELLSIPVARLKLMAPRAFGLTDKSKRLVNLEVSHQETEKCNLSY